MKNKLYQFHLSQDISRRIFRNTYSYETFPEDHTIFVYERTVNNRDESAY